MKKKDYYLEDSSKKATTPEETSFVLDVYIQMVIDEALFKRKKALLEEKVNAALDQKDHIAFLKYSREYNKLSNRLPA